MQKKEELKEKLDHEIQSLTHLNSALDNLLLAEALRYPEMRSSIITRRKARPSTSSDDGDDSERSLTLEGLSHPERQDHTRSSWPSFPITRRKARPSTSSDDGDDSERSLTLEGLSHPERQDHTRSSWPSFPITRRKARPSTSSDDGDDSERSLTLEGLSHPERQDPTGSSCLWCSFLIGNQERPSTLSDDSERLPTLEDTINRTSPAEEICVQISTQTAQIKNFVEAIKQLQKEIPADCDKKIMQMIPVLQEEVKKTIQLLGTKSRMQGVSESDQEIHHGLEEILSIIDGINSARASVKASIQSSSWKAHVSAKTIGAKCCTIS